MKLAQPIYRVSHSKVFKETIKELEDISVNGEKMNVFFCKNEKGIFVIAGLYDRYSPSRSGGHWSRGGAYYDIYFRKNFRTKEEGNAFYLKVLSLKSISR